MEVYRRRKAKEMMDGVSGMISKRRDEVHD